MKESPLKSLQNQLKTLFPPVKLVVVTKYADLKTTQQLIEDGAEALAENRVEAAQEKFSQLPHSLKFERHFIGQIQSKKIPRIIETFDVIQSVGSNHHLLKIDQVAQQMNKPLQVFLQFCISGEPQKNGYPISALTDIRRALKEVQFVQVVGLMGMASRGDKKVIRAEFKILRGLRDELQKDFPSIKELSMGMSEDYQIAIEEGATMVRIGRGLGIESLNY